MTDDLAPLLEELKEVDFETWKDIKFLLSNMMLWPEPNQQPLEQNAYQDIIQGCIQRAICSHPGWSWEILPRKDTGTYYIADIYPRSGMYMGRGNTPAAALLTCYLQAKKAIR